MQACESTDEVTGMIRRGRFQLALVLLTSVIASAGSLSLARQRATGGRSYMVYIGTYTVRDSKGIYAYHFKSGHLTPVGATGLVAETPNPSFLAVDPGHRYLYAANESVPGGKNGTVSAFAIDRATG